ncbi:hypothetical protein MMMB2_1723 [Mycobacterium marinum MB2]|nr:hypothetical protein MMMB2_1723 [Mycobacterium marinum MB2]
MIAADTASAPGWMTSVVARIALALAALIVTLIFAKFLAAEANSSGAAMTYDMCPPGSVRNSQNSASQSRRAVLSRA